MSALDYNRIGALRIEKDRLLARIERLEEVGNSMVAWGTSEFHRGQWEEAKAWDGCPKDDRASTHRYFKGQV